MIPEFVQAPFLRLNFWPSLQQEKEALDDLAMELELADEDQPVMYVQAHLPYTSASRLIRI
jgi:hypothetical protein